MYVYVCICQISVGCFVNRNVEVLIKRACMYVCIMYMRVCTCVRMYARMNVCKKCPRTGLCGCWFSLYLHLCIAHIYVYVPLCIYEIP
jgi:hypothetical protein